MRSPAKYAEYRRLWQPVGPAADHSRSNVQGHQHEASASDVQDEPHVELRNVIHAVRPSMMRACIERCLPPGKSAFV